MNKTILKINDRVWTVHVIKFSIETQKFLVEFEDGHRQWVEEKYVCEANT